MALIQSLNKRAIRLRVILLDKTELPLYLQPFQYLSVADSDLLFLTSLKDSSAYCRNLHEVLDINS